MKIVCRYFKHFHPLRFWNKLRFGSGFQKIKSVLKLGNGKQIQN